MRAKRIAHRAVYYSLDRREFVAPLADSAIAVPAARGGRVLPARVRGDGRRLRAGDDGLRRQLRLLPGRGELLHVGGRGSAGRRRVASGDAPRRRARGVARPRTPHGGGARAGTGGRGSTPCSPTWTPCGGTRRAPRGSGRAYRRRSRWWASRVSSVVGHRMARALLKRSYLVEGRRLRRLTAEDAGTWEARLEDPGARARVDARGLALERGAD